MLTTAKNHMDFGGSPVKKINTSDIMPLMMTCHPMAMYFSCDFLRRKFQSACSDADRKSRMMARMGMGQIVNPKQELRVLSHR